MTTRERLRGNARTGLCVNKGITCRCQCLYSRSLLNISVMSCCNLINRQISAHVSSVSLVVIQFKEKLIRLGPSIDFIVLSVTLRIICEHRQKHCIGYSYSSQIFDTASSYFLFIESFQSQFGV